MRWVLERQWSLALILTHTRQDVKQDALTLPEVGGVLQGLGKAEHMFSRKHHMLNIWLALSQHFQFILRLMICISC